METRATRFQIEDRVETTLLAVPIRGYVIGFYVDWSGETQANVRYADTAGIIREEFFFERRLKKLEDEPIQ